jgi:hypothetical protein
VSRIILQLKDKKNSMTIKFAVGLLKVFWLIVVLCLLIGHGSRTGPVYSERQPPTPCGAYIRNDEPYFCIDGENTEQDLQAIAGQSTIDGDLIIEGTNFTSLEFLTNIAAITGRLVIAGNSSLLTISTVAGISQVSSLLVEKNSSLTNFQGLNNINEISQEVIILSNDSLTTLSDFSVGSTVDHIQIAHNPMLQDVGVLQSLKYVNGNLIIASNKLASLLDLSQLISVGDLGITERNIVNLSGLENLQSIDGALFIAGCDNLVDFTGLSSLNSYGSLKVNYNQLITSLSSLPLIPPTLAELNLIGNNLLTNIQSLGIVTSVGDIEIAENAALTSLAALASLQQASSLVIDNNVQLTQLGMSALGRIDSEFIIRDNDMLCEQEAQDLISQILSQGGIGAAGNTTEGIIVSGNLNCP